MKSPAERSSAAKIGAHVSWAKTEDRKARTRPGQRGLVARFEREVDPDGKLEPAERAKRADHLYRAHMIRLAAKSAESRRRAS